MTQNDDFFASSEDIFQTKNR